MRRLAPFAVVLAAASADAWQVPEPVPRGEPSPDGRTYLLVNPLGERHLAACVLVRRREGAGPWRAPARRAEETDPPPLAPDAGDVVLSRVERDCSADERCLDRERGYVLFDSHAQPGMGVVLEVRDARGKVSWSKRLEDLFTPAEVRAFVDIGGARVWTWGWWVDLARDEAVVLARGGHLRRVELATGRVLDRAAGPDEEAALRDRIATGRESERRSALAAAEERRVSGLTPVLERQLAGTDGLSAGWRVEVAAALLRQTDHAGAWEALLAGLAPDRPESVRRAAANALRKALGSATADRRAKVLATARLAGSSEARWLLEQVSK
jgi:hypothetical protein